MVRHLSVCAGLMCSFVLIASFGPLEASAAKTPVCGSTDREGNTILGSLALNDNSSTIKSYGTGTGERQLVLLYDVKGCTLPRETTIERSGFSILPDKTGDDLLGQPTVTLTVANPPDPTAVRATVAFTLDDVDPGTRGGIVRIQAPRHLEGSFTPISISRTDSPAWPVVFGLLGSLAGLFWAGALHFAKPIEIRFTRRQGFLLFVLAVGAGLVAGFGYWQDQEVWTRGENGWETVVTGFTASTAGALAGVTTTLLAPKATAKEGDLQER